MTMKKFTLIFILFLFFHFGKAQNEFITIWKPSNQSTTIPSLTQSSSQEIWFPGTGTNFSVSWEEVGFPAHNGNIANATSVKQFLINFGTPLNPNPSNATYKVKISNGNGSFQTVRFADAIFISPNLNIPVIQNYSGDQNKILEVSPWGNISWLSMEGAYANCHNVDVTAADIPNLSNVTSSSLMFFECLSLLGNPTFNTWNTGTITNMSHMFASAGSFNQPVGNWNTINVTNMTWMFHYLSQFNQDLSNWNVSNVTQMEHMFHRCYNFNQSLASWNTSNVTNMKSMLEETTNFNQSLGNWNLTSLTNATGMIYDSGIDCENYNSTLIGWASNPSTHVSVNLGSTSPLQYSSTAALNARNTLINTKAWVFNGDIFNAECEPRLGTSETENTAEVFIYPNPTHDFINIRNYKNISSYKIFDFSGRIVLSKNNFTENRIDVSSLQKGNYILEIASKKSVKKFKFIKK